MKYVYLSRYVVADIINAAVSAGVCPVGIGGKVKEIEWVGGDFKLILEGTTADDDMLSVTVGDGKYTVVQDASGRLSALRYGEPWRDCVGDGLILALAQEVQALRDAATDAGQGIDPPGP